MELGVSGKSEFLMIQINKLHTLTNLETYNQLHLIDTQLTKQLVHNVQYA